MKPKQSLEWIKDFESKCSDINYHIAGIDCWPIVRNTLLSIGLPKSRQGAGEGYNIAGTSLLDLLKSIGNLFSFKKANTFILSDSKFSEKISNSLYLKDSHVISERAKLQSNTSVIALQNLFVNKDIVGRERCRSVFGVLLLAAGVAKFSRLMKSIPGVSRYVEGIFIDLAAAPMLHDGTISSKALKKQVYKNILFCLVASKIFSFILQRVKPENAYVVCYYSVLGMALCAACRQLGIPVTDVQHGVAGGSMRAYAGWLQVPRKGYTTLPDMFFCWTKFDAEAITDWAQRTDRHHAVVTGSMWRNYAVEQSLLADAERQWSGFFKEISSYKKRVLITMQSSVLAPLFVEVVKQCEPSYCFLIRRHPGFSMENNESYIELIDNYPNVFFEQPSALPLQVLMKNVDMHLTEWSGAVIDAYFEGVRSVVISEEALDYFEDFILAGRVVYASTLKGVMEAFE